MAGAGDHGAASPSDCIGDNSTVGDCITVNYSSTNAASSIVESQHEYSPEDFGDGLEDTVSFGNAVPFEAMADTSYFDMVIDSILSSNDAKPSQSLVSDMPTPDYTDVSFGDNWCVGADPEMPSDCPRGSSEGSLIDGHGEQYLNSDELHECSVFSPPSTECTTDSWSLHNHGLEKEETFHIVRLASHNVDHETSTVDFHVEWEGGEHTWEPEKDLQLQVPRLVLAYWDDNGGRLQMTGLEQFHVLRVLSYDRSVDQYRVQWVGHRRTIAETSWEPSMTLTKIAPEELHEFQRKQDSRRNSVGDKNRKPRRVGRPRSRKSKNRE